MLHKTKATLLIVDDELMIRKGLKNSIDWKSLNIEVVGTAENGLIAYQLINQLQPDIVITDIKMPVCDGIELIKKVYHDNLNTKFIIISGFDDFKYAQKAIQYKVQNYLLKPIKKTVLINTLKDIVKKTKDEKNQSINSDENKKQIKLGKEALKQNFFTNLINSAYTNRTEFENAIYNLDIRLQSQPITLILFEYQLPDKIFSHQLSKEDNLLFRFAFKNILEDILHNQIFEVFKIRKNQLAAIIDQSSNDDNALMDPINICNRIINVIHTHMGVDIIASIGNTVEDLYFLHHSYESATSLLAYKMYDNENKITVYHKSLFDESTDKVANPFNYSSSIIDAIIDNDVSVLRSELDVFFDSLLYIPTPPPSYVRGMCNYFIMDISKKLCNSFNCNNLLAEVPQNAINTIDKFVDIKQWIFNLLVRYSEMVLEMKENQTNLPIYMAKRYVKNNITNKILVKDVASHVNLSESYFAAIFKKATGINFRTYVLNQKIDYAKEKLKTSNMTIGEIAESLGYDDYRSFNRMFKKATGQTPSLIRKD